VTPIIGGRAIKGPAGKMLAELGLEVSAAAVARRYAGLAGGFVTDASDPLPAAVPEMQYFRTNTLMVSTEDRVRLAQEVLRAADAMPSNGGRHG
jgi:LPPG:FO 2-phospho-L-lactate transferase